MDVGEDAGASSRMAGAEQTPEETQEGLVTWTWTPDQAGGSINMYMYNNTMSMTNTDFSMDKAQSSGMWTGPTDRMAEAGGPEVNINMYMYDNNMSMDNTIFTMKVVNAVFRLLSLVQYEKCFL